MRVSRLGVLGLRGGLPKVLRAEGEGHGGAYKTWTCPGFGKKTEYSRFSAR